MKIIINYKLPKFKDNKIIQFDIINKYTIDLLSIENKIKGGDIFDEINLDDIIIKKDKDKKDIYTNNINQEDKDKDKITISKKNSILKEVDKESLISKSNKKLNFSVIDNSLIKKHKIQVKKEKLYNNYIINKINFSKFNSLYDIKLLIYYLLNVPIENQYLYSSNYPSLFYSYQNITTLEYINTNIEEIINDSNIKYFNNIPIDFDIINNRNSYKITTYEKNSYINNVIDSILELDLIILDELILDKELLNSEIQKDDELLNILYSGFIEKFFPYYDDNLFLLYLNKENKYIEYPNLKIKSSNIIDKCDKISEIFSYKNIKLNISKYPRKFIYQISSYNNIKNINLQDIFNNIEIIKIPNLKKIELQLLNDDKYIYFNKINIINNINNLEASQKLYINNKNYNSLLNSNYLNNKNIVLFVYNIINDKYEINELIYIILDEYFNIFIINNINTYNILDDKIYEKIIIDNINIFLLNLYKNKIISKKKEINKLNLQLISFDYQIILNENIGNQEFQKLINNIKEYENIDFYKILNIDNINNILELELNKINYLLKSIDINLLEYTNNFYQFYSNYILSEKYSKLLYTTKINIVNRIKDIKIELINFNSDEYNNIYPIILFLLHNILSNKSKTNNIIVSTNKLKKLKEIDPVLYNINKKNTNNLYSRKCQSSQQPEIATEKEIKSKKIQNYIKYWNFTTGEPIYYYCDSKKFPTVKFLTNLHPNNYCIPCCKKKSLDDVKIKSKYVDIHKECLQNYIYDKKKSIIDEKSRYIMNYSSKIIIENLRLMQIPDTLNKLFIKYYDLSDEGRDTDLNYYILGLNQDTTNITNLGILHILAFILDKKLFDTIEIIKDLFIKDNNFIKFIYNSNLLNYYNSTKDFLIIFNNLFQNKILLKDLNYEFNEWNELFIDIAKYLGYIFIIFEEDENLNLIIPPNIKFVNEYIYSNENYKFVFLIKRNYKNKFLYYPIIRTNYLEYYNSNKFYNKFYFYNDNIVNIIKQIVKKSLNSNQNNLSLNLNIIEEFILENKYYKILKYFINQKFEIYAILLEKEIKSKKEYIYLIINKQKVINEYYSNKNINKLLEFNYIKIGTYNIKLNNILEFIKDYNKYIYLKNKNYYSEHYLKLYINELSINKDLNNIINLHTIIQNYQNIETNNINNNEKLILYDYIYINNFLICNNKIIGIQINNNNSYISSNLELKKGIELIDNKKKYIQNILKKNKINKEDIINILIREFNNYKFSTINYLYNPHNINNIIYNKQQKLDTRISKLNESLYHTNLYNLLLLHFTYELNSLKNTIIRNKIKLLINNMTNKDFDLIINNKYNKLKEIFNKSLNIKDNNLFLKIYNNIYKFLKDNIINLFDNSLNNYKDVKKSIINNFDNTKFLIDKLYIYDILNLKKEKAINELNNILKNVIIDTKINNKYNILNIELCSKTTESYYCKNNKLIISHKFYKELLEILYYDLTNPFKQTLILNLLNYNLNNIYKFKQNINEKIYIYL